MANSNSTNSVKNIAIVGAGGNSGRGMAECLVESGKHTVTALTRFDSTTALPKGVEVAKIDYSNPSTIVEALRGQEVLIITLSIMADKEHESTLIKAAAEAGVSFVFPNVWSPDTADEVMSTEAIFGRGKKETRELIESLGQSSWVSFNTGFWYEWSLAITSAYGFDFQKREVTLFDEGETKITTTTWPQVGRAVAAFLGLKLRPEGEHDKSPNLEQFRNKHVYVGSFTVSQKDMLESVLRVTGTKVDDWKVTKEPAKERYQGGIQRMMKGDRAGFGTAMYTRVFFPDDSGNTEKTRGLLNEALGLPKEDIDEATKAAIERAVKFNGTW